MVGNSGDIIETTVCAVISALCILATASHVAKDLKLSKVSQFEVNNDNYVILAIKVWSGLFVILVAAVLVISGTTIPMQQLNLFLVIALTGIMVDVMPIFAYIFSFASALSWYDLYYAFIHSPSGITLSRLFEPKWIVAFYCMTSCVLSGHLKERSKVLHIKSSIFQLSCIIFLWSLPLPLKLICDSFKVDVKFFNEWNSIPLRLQEMEFEEYQRLVSIVCMVLLHFGTRLLIASADSETVDNTNSKKTDAISPEDSPADTIKGQYAHSSPYHKYTNSGNDVEGKADSTEGPKDIDLPADCVEVSEEEAVRIVEGGGRKKNSSGLNQRNKQ